jgi:4-hydroxybenzoate polyprenyltransferase
LGTFSVIYDLFAKRLRLSNPWNYKAPVLVAVTYLILAWQKVAFLDALFAFGWSLCTIIGIAGFGYLSNDFGDRKADAKAGKSNLLIGLSRMQISGLLVLFLALAVVPWLVYFPVTALTISLLLSEFLLFILYVLPPFRLKERGLLGVITDSLYAHAVPATLAGLTFLVLLPTENQAFPIFLPTLVVWQFFLGMRNILLHQLKDAKNDRVSGIHTFVTRHGEAKVNRWMSNLFVPLELLTWLLFLGALTPVTWLPLLGWPLYLLWQFPKQGPHREFRQWLYGYLDDFYIPYFPLLILISLCFQDWRMIFLAVFHVILFKSALSETKRRVFAWIRKPL